LFVAALEQVAVANAFALADNADAHRRLQEGRDLWSTGKREHGKRHTQQQMYDAEGELKKSRRTFVVGMPDA
jgi:hypothetical protein